MALLPAFAIDGGRVPASMLRMVAWVATSGASGIVQPTDLRVRALTTPGGAVSVAPGGAVIATRYSNSTAQQSYMVANDQSFNVTIPAAGASGRTDYVILRINDPQYAGQARADPETALYCEGVTVASLPTTYPYVPLAKIVIPANTAAITNAMITDLRKVANPRKERHLFAYDLSAANADLLTTEETWPNVVHYVDIPEWATRAHIVATYAQVLVPAGSNQQGWLGARLSGGGTGVNSPTTRFDGSAPASRTRQTFVAAGDIYVPAQMRGYANGEVRTRATVSADDTDGRLKLDAGSAVVVDIEFREAAD